MQVTSFESLKLKTHLEHLVKAPSLDNAKSLKSQIQKVKDQNFQLVQDVFLSTLLRLMDEAAGKNKNEMKTVYMECINLIVGGSQLNKLLPYKMLLMIPLKQIFDFETNQVRKGLSEEFKLAVLSGFQVSSTNLNCDVVEQFMVEENKILLGQCIFVCREMIVNENYSKIRRKAIEALQSLLQIHDKADQRDVVLRDQISRLIFFILPQISSALIKVCQEDTFKGHQLVETAIRVLGRFLCLIFEDYEKKSIDEKVTSEDFKNLLTKICAENQSEIKRVMKAKPKGEELMTMKRTQEWLQAACSRISIPLAQIKCLRGDENRQIRHELCNFSVNLLKFCLLNIKPLVTFLLENLLALSDDEDEQIRSSAAQSLAVLSEKIPDLSQEVSELFKDHLTVMPRIVLTGDESEQIAAFKLINGLVQNDQNNFAKNPELLQKFMNVMLSCCEIEVPNELLLYDNSTSNDLQDQFYQMKSPWRKFKNLKNEQIISKFTDVCRTMASYDSADIYINYILESIDSLEFLVLMIEILKSKNLSSPTELIEEIVDEFLKDEYWIMQTTPPAMVQKQSFANEEWYKDSVPGLYESAIEIRMKDVSLEDDSNSTKSHEITLKEIKYNILSTCFILDLVGTAAACLQSRFQTYLLKLLHRVLQKAGNSNLLIRLAGLECLDRISSAVGYQSVNELIDRNSEVFLFNIHNALKKSDNDGSIVDMFSVILKFSNKSMIGYFEDMIRSVDERIVNQHFSNRAACYLKLFQLYTSSITDTESSEKSNEHDAENRMSWEVFYEQCIHELENKSQEYEEPEATSTETETEEPQNEDQPVEAAQEDEKPKTPDQIRLILQILKTSLQFFASKDPHAVILTHEIFLDSLPLLSHFEDEFLPMIHEMWYPFTKQFQIQNLVVLQRSFQLLAMIVNLAKDFVYKKSTDDVFPLINKFLETSMKNINCKENRSYTQEFKLLKEVLNGYGKILMTLDIDDKEMDKIVGILLKYEKSSNQSLALAANVSLNDVRKGNPGLLEFKKAFI